MQKWNIYVDGKFAHPVRTDRGKGAQYVLNKAKKVWPGCHIEVVAVL